MVANRALASRAADWICLAAAPAFALLALASFVDTAPDMLCMPGHSTLGGMAVMYLLMSAVHLAPWLKRISRHGRAGRESYP